MSTHSMMFPSEWSERMAYERAKAGYWPYDIEDLRHFCALRDLRIEELKAENAKLRELAVRAYKTAKIMCEAWDGPCQSNSDVPSWKVPCPTDERDEQCVFGQLERDMRELGVEVDDG